MSTPDSSLPNIRGTASNRVTISDIARAANVSPATVSLVLRDKAGISEATRQRVRETAQALGYLPSTPTQNTNQPKQLKDIGLIIKVDDNEEGDPNSFYAPIIAGIESVCRRWQSHLRYGNLPVDPRNQPLELPLMLRDENIDGLLMIGMELTEGFLAHLQQRKLPIILVDSYAQSGFFDAVLTDNVQGGIDATNYLISQGHTVIAIVGSTADAYPSIQERRMGYVQAMTAHGLEPIFADSVLRQPEASEAAAKLVTQSPEITAIFACNDEVATATSKKMQELGKRVPKDISIIGFDNIALTQHVTPALTTMRVDKMSMGRLAAHLMFNRLDHPEASIARTIIQPRLIERDSVARVRPSSRR